MSPFGGILAGELRRNNTFLLYAHPHGSSEKVIGLEDKESKKGTTHMLL